MRRDCQVSRLSELAQFSGYELLLGVELPPSQEVSGGF